MFLAVIMYKTRSAAFIYGEKVCLKKGKHIDKTINGVKKMIQQLYKYNCTYILV